MSHWFWLIIFVASTVWYCTITVYVAIKGARDIKAMLARLADGVQDPTDA